MVKRLSERTAEVEGHGVRVSIGSDAASMRGRNRVFQTARSVSVLGITAGRVNTPTGASSPGNFPGPQERDRLKLSILALELHNTMLCRDHRCRMNRDLRLKSSNQGEDYLKLYVLRRELQPRMLYQDHPCRVERDLLRKCNSQGKVRIKFSALSRELLHNVLCKDRPWEVGAVSPLERSSQSVHRINLHRLER
jgi:hypothetical protein